MKKPLLSDTLGFVIGCALICAVTVIAYWPVTGASFLVSYDDELYVTHNPHVLSGPSPQNFVWAFTTFEAGNWHPLTWLSHMVDCCLFGLNPYAHHLMNLAFHLVNIILLLYALWKATGSLWRSAFVAALFALHPMHAESVAWVSERKDVLSTMFWLLTLIAYIRYVKVHRARWYGAAIVSYCLGLMAKPMLVTLPFTLLLLDAWPLARVFRIKTPENEPAQSKRSQKAQRTKISPAPLPWRKAWLPLVAEKIPFFALAAASSIVAIIAQSNKHAVVSVGSLSVIERAGNAIHSYGVYLSKMIAPVHLACFYPFPLTQPTLETAIALCILVATTTVCVVYRRRMPFLPTGWLWYLGTLVPVIGLVQVGVQSMADRYTYVPFIGIFIMISWGLFAAASHLRIPGPALSTIACAVVLALAFATRVNAAYWKNSETLFGHAASVTAHNDVAWLNLGVALSTEGKTDSAMACFNRALAARPGDKFVAYDAYNNLGIACSRAGKTTEALAYCQKAVELAQDQAEAYFNLAAAQTAVGKYAEALEAYRSGLRYAPDDFDAHNNCGDLLARAGKSSDALAEYEYALRLRPDAPLTLCNAGRLRANAGDISSAIDCFIKAIRVRPDLAVAHINLGVALAMEGKINDAVKHFSEAVRLNPRSAEALADLARGLAAQGDTTGAITRYKNALRLDSRNVDTRLNYGALLAGSGNVSEASRQFEAILKTEPDNAIARKNLRLIIEQRSRGNN
jgi:tetratricopeptide (TPR) repeat protein